MNIEQKAIEYIEYIEEVSQQPINEITKKTLILMFKYGASHGIFLSQRWRRIEVELPENDEELKANGLVNTTNPTTGKSGLIKTKAVIVRYNHGGVVLAHRCKCSTDDYYWWDCNESFDKNDPNYITHYLPIPFIQK